MHGASSIQFDPDTRAKRSTGLTLGILGPIAMVAGMVMVVIGSMPEGHDTDKGTLTTGIVALLGGLTITPIGWVMFGTSFKPEYKVRSLEAEEARGGRPRHSGWAFGLIPTRNGAGFGGQIRF